jgi:tRNA G18 (ribose-2'-O)-methylase SpoU
MKRLNARQLRTSEPDDKIIRNLKKNPIYIVCDSVLDTYNVGAIFRLADAMAVKKVYLCGYTETPPNPKIKKASINTWKWVDWEYIDTAFHAVSKIKGNNPKVNIVAIEQHEKSIALRDFKPQYPVCLVVGNETYGVSKEILKIADTIIELPMYGVNRSLNVMVCCGIVLYHISNFLPGK